MFYLHLKYRDRSCGLPIGVQFVGQWGGEALLYRLAAQLEQALPWDERKLDICA
tara:strand:- start:769 stop:930 length:162 start_codon:yes stop_codon:yes gene_type:complete